MSEGQSVIEVIRAVAARRNAIYAYAQAHDHFAEQEQAFTAEGRTIEAQGAHEYAGIALRAYRNEMDDPTPPSLGDHDDRAREGYRP